MDKVVVEMTSMEKRVFRNAMNDYMATFIDKTLSQEDRLKASIMVEFIDKNPDKISVPIKSKIKMKYHQAYVVHDAIITVLPMFDEHNFEYVVLSQIKDQINQKL